MTQDKISNTKFLLVLFAFIGLFSRNAVAGFVEEANIVYIDFASPKNTAVSDEIRRAINSESPECWNKGRGVIYMKTRPVGVSDELVRSAVLRQNRSSKIKLKKILMEYADENVNGLDGIILYQDIPSPRFISFSAKRKHIRTQLIGNIAVPKDIELAFCGVKPDIVRKP